MCIFEKNLISKYTKILIVRLIRLKDQLVEAFIVFFMFKRHKKGRKYVKAWQEKKLHLLIKENI